MLFIACDITQMADIILLRQPSQPPALMTPDIYPDFLTQFSPPTQVQVGQTEQITYAKIGMNQVTLSPEEMQRDRERVPRQRTFEPYTLAKKRGPLIIQEKRWYFRLVQRREGDTTYRSRALMDDFDINTIAHHMVVCFTPDQLPGNNKPFRTPDGDPGRLYAFFDSYLEFYEYLQRFNREERSFYEVCFGELPQKPHFDIDIERTVHDPAFPGVDIDVTAETLRECVIGGCIEVLRDNKISLDMTRDILIYSSHGPDKRSYHIIINNRCHDGNKEAEAFYNSVMEKVHGYTQGKYKGFNFVDRGVYSPRQQFRLVGCQKWNSGRPKVFYEQYWYGGQQYTHTYNEDTTDPLLKKITIIYESMISFTSGCSFLPSLIPERPVNQNQLGDLPDLENTVVDKCLEMLRAKMNPCPFVKREVRGHVIILKRLAPSFCPICHPAGTEKVEPHKKEHPYMFIIGGKVYWDCRRSQHTAKKFFVGYLAMTMDDLQNGTMVNDVDEIEEPEDTGGEFMFGDYNIGLPTLLPKQTVQPTIQNIQQVVQPVQPIQPVQQDRPIIQPVDLPPEQRMQNMPAMIMKMVRDKAQKQYYNREPEDVMGRVSLATVKGELSWNAGFN